MVKKKSIFPLTKLSDVVSMKSGESITAERITSEGKFPCFGGNGLRGYTTTFTHDGSYTLVGRQGALCGNVTFVSGRFYASEHAIVVTPKKETDIKFVSYVLYDMNFNQYSESSAQPGLSVKKLLELEYPIPKNKEEQTAIAEALSDVDSLISSLQKLIEKKKAIKQGAMQELLTGKKRLPGFYGEWEHVKLKDIILDFIVPMRDKPKDLSGEIPWCRIEDFNGKYLSKSKSGQGVTFDTVNRMNLKIFPKETLIVSCSAYLGRCAIVKTELITNQTFIGLVAKSNVSVEFLFYVMCKEEKNLNLLSSGTTISYLSREQFEEYLIYIPKDLAEQQSIAQVLSDMDSEIEQLEKKLSKYQQIKQGMMQELLTGRIRLV